MKAKPPVKPAATKPTAVATRAVSSVPLDTSKFSDASGFEEVDSKCLAVPRLGLLQATSKKELDEIEGAKAGMLFNQITHELYTDVQVVPCYFSRRYIRWAPRVAGVVGFKGEYLPAPVDDRTLEGLQELEGFLMMDVPANTAKVLDKDGKPLFDTLSDTRNHYVLVKSADGNWQPALLSMKSTQIKKSKNWVTQMKMAMIDGKPVAMFRYIYKLTVVEESNAKGNWHGFKIDMVKAVDDQALLDMAYAFHETVKAGKIAVDPPAADEEVDDKPKGF